MANFKHNIQLGVDLSQMRKGITNIDREIQKLSGGFGVLGSAIGAAFVVDTVVDFGKEFIELQRQAVQVGNAFEQFASRADLAQLRLDTRGLISDIELMKRTVQARNFGIGVEQLGTYFEFASVRAAETGESVDYLVDSILTGIGRESKLVIDNLGISQQRLNAELEKGGTFAEAVGRIISEEMENSGQPVVTLSDQISGLGIAFENLKTSIAGLGTAESGVLGRFTKGLNNVADIIKGEGFLSGAGKGILALFGPPGVGEALLEANAAGLNALADAQQETNEAIEQGTGLTADQQKAEQKRLETLAKLRKELEQQQQAQADAFRKSINVGDEISGLRSLGQFQPLSFGVGEVPGMEDERPVDDQAEKLAEQFAAMKAQAAAFDDLLKGTLLSSTGQLIDNFFALGEQGEITFQSLADAVGDFVRDLGEAVIKAVALQAITAAIGGGGSVFAGQAGNGVGVVSKLFGSDILMSGKRAGQNNTFGGL